MMIITLIRYHRQRNFRLKFMREDMREDHRYIPRHMLGIEVSWIGKEMVQGLSLGRTPLVVQGHAACLVVGEEIKHGCWVDCFVLNVSFSSVSFLCRIWFRFAMVRKMVWRVWSVHCRSVLVLFAWMNCVG
jgi:hypothetical protein